MRTTYGSQIYENNIPESSDFLVERIEQMGGIIIGYEIGRILNKETIFSEGING